MKARELRSMTEESLTEELLKLRREQFNLRMQAATGQGAKPDQHGKVRKDIARIISHWFKSLPIGPWRRQISTDDPDARMGWLIILGSLPIVIAGLTFADTIEYALRNLYITAAVLTFFLVGCGAPAEAQRAQQGEYEAFHLSEVRLLDGPFKHAQDTNLEYLLELDPDRFLAPYLREAGLEPRAESYGNWENTGLDGHIGGHYLSALAMMYASTGHAEIHRRLTYMIDELERVQEAHGDGYIGGVPDGRATWDEIRRGDIRADLFSLNGKWVPWYNVHKVYAGLRDAYTIGGNEKALDLLIGLTDWAVELVSGLSDEQIQSMLTFLNTGPDQIPGVIVMYLSDEADLDPEYDQIVVIFNATPDEVSFSNEIFAGHAFALHPVFVNSADEIVQSAAFDAGNGAFSVPALTTAVFVNQ